ncbi:MAG: helix-turn-helix transcriptional regulator [bacterium]|nr:helix-turn-helix transcriptional regulator [bacterium]
MLKNKAVRADYERLRPRFEIIQALIRRRLERGLTQAQLARRIGTKQSAISRLESGTVNPTLALLDQVARAVGGRVHITIK